MNDSTLIQGESSSLIKLPGNIIIDTQSFHGDSKSTQVDT